MSNIGLLEEFEMKNLICAMMVLVMPGLSLGANDICVHLNGGVDVAYIGEYNTLEIWVANDIDIKTLQFGMIVTWSPGPFDWVWTMAYGSHSPFDWHGDAENLILFASDVTFDNVSPETFLAGGAGLMPTQVLPPAASRLCYSLEFGLPFRMVRASSIQVQPYAYSGSFNWWFMRTDDSQFPPDFCGEPVSSMHDPVATPATFDVVQRPQAVCGDSDCSGDVDIDDVVYLIAYIFSGGPAPCDIDGDGVPDC
jgi:hypothetical protein